MLICALRQAKNSIHDSIMNYMCFKALKKIYMRLYHAQMSSKAARKTLYVILPCSYML